MPSSNALKGDAFMLNRSYGILHLIACPSFAHVPTVRLNRKSNELEDN